MHVMRCPLQDLQLPFVSGQSRLLSTWLPLLLVLHPSISSTCQALHTNICAPEPWRQFRLVQMGSTLLTHIVCLQWFCHGWIHSLSPWMQEHPARCCSRQCRLALAVGLCLHLSKIHSLNSTMKPKPFPGLHISYCGQLDAGPSALPVELLEAGLESSCLVFLVLAC